MCEKTTVAYCLFLNWYFCICISNLNTFIICQTTYFTNTIFGNNILTKTPKRIFSDIIVSSLKTTSIYAFIKYINEILLYIFNENFKITH